MLWNFKYSCSVSFFMGSPQRYHSSPSPNLRLEQRLKAKARCSNSSIKLWSKLVEMLHPNLKPQEMSFFHFINNG